MQVWGERYDRDLKDIFSVQDDVRKNIVKTLSITLTEDEHRRLSQRYTNSVEAYDYFLKGRSHLGHRTKNGNTSAREFYTRALNLDPGFARAYSGIAMTHVNALRFGWSSDEQDSVKNAKEYADKALKTDKNLPQAYWVQGYINLFIKRDYDSAIRLSRKTLELEPDDVDGMALLAVANVYSGDYAYAENITQKAMLINPEYSSQLSSALGMAYLFSGETEKAEFYLEDALQKNANRIQSNIHLIVCYMRLGRIEDAKWQVEQLKLIEPTFSLKKWTSRQPFRDTSILNAMVADLRKAGL